MYLATASSFLTVPHFVRSPSWLQLVRGTDRGRALLPAVPIQSTPQGPPRTAAAAAARPGHQFPWDVSFGLNFVFYSGTLVASPWLIVTGVSFLPGAASRVCHHGFSWYFASY